MYKKDRLRRSMMFVPGNNPGMIRDAHIYGADSIMFDLEDSVAYTEKDAARFLVYNALKTLHFGTKETVVRINDLSSGLGIEDLEAVVRAGRLAVAYRNRYGRDIVIDLVCYRRRGHNEGDEPSFTQPLMYKLIDAHPPVRKLYLAHLVDSGDISVDEGGARTPATACFSR